MILVLVISVTTALLAYGVVGLVDEWLNARRRLSLAMGIRAKNIAQVGFNRTKVIAKITQEQKVRMTKRPPLADLIARAGLDLSARTVRLLALLCACLGSVIAMVATGKTIIAAIVAVFCYLVVPRVVLGILISRRQAAFFDKLPDALDMISRGLRAGMPLATCLKQIAETASEPVRSEFAYVIDLQKMGIPLGEAMKKMPERIDLLDLRFFTIVIEVQQKSGGNLSEIIENLSSVIRGRREMRAKIKALISEAKVSSIIIGALPIFFGLMSWYADPGSFSKFWTETIGQILLGLAFVLYSVGMGIFIYLATPKS